MMGLFQSSRWVPKGPKSVPFPDAIFVQISLLVDILSLPIVCQFQQLPLAGMCSIFGMCKLRLPTCHLVVPSFRISASWANLDICSPLLLPEESDCSGFVRGKNRRRDSWKAGQRKTALSLSARFLSPLCSCCILTDFQPTRIPGKHASHMEQDFDVGAPPNDERSLFAFRGSVILSVDQ